MPGLSKEDRIKDSSVIIDTGELVDTFLSDQSLLEKIADTINKSIETQKETSSIQEGNVLDPPTLEKALDSTQSDPQIKNVLDEFLGKFHHTQFEYINYIIKYFCKFQFLMLTILVIIKKNVMIHQTL